MNTACRLIVAPALLMLCVSPLSADVSAGPSLERLLESQLVAPRFKAQLSRMASAGRSSDAQTLPAVLRFETPLTRARIAQLEQGGLSFERLGGEVARVGSFYGVRARPAALSALLDASELRRVLPPHPVMIRPSPLDSVFDQVHELTTAKQLWPRRDAEGRTLTGAGVVICDIDGATDIFHPMFFRPDAGLYSWIDVDGDGVLSPGQDAVDLDGDGAVGEGETLQSLGGDVVDLYYGDVIDRALGFHPARQWLYADTDGSGAREFGPGHGFGELDPAYGEPLFLADDVDRDGVIEPGEKLTRLGSSKYRGVYRVASGETFRRGENLIALTRNPDAGHGAGVGGILAGGEYGRTFVHGVAPDAELLLIDQGLLEEEYDGHGNLVWDATMIRALAWAQDEGAQIFVHEYGTPVGEFADGSSDWEQLLDELTAEGSVQVTATHNFADNEGHAELVIPASGELQVPIEVFDYWGYPSYYLQGTLRWRDAAARLEATLVTPAQVEIPLDGEYWEAGDYAFGETSFSSRGTGMIDLLAARLSSAGYPDQLPIGDWSLRITNPTDREVDAYLAVTDDSGYSISVALGVETTQLGTIAHPSTADSAISVGASVGNYVDWGEVDEGIKRYSGRGPRIDGEYGVDVVAPEDHYTAAPDPSGAGGADYMSFGGTSGALPQVAGAIALLLQAEPALNPAEVKARLHDRSDEDNLTGALPNDEWGYGRLAVHRLVTGESPRVNTPPLAVLEVPARVEQGEAIVIDASASSDAEDGDGLRYRFDVGYDGDFELEGGEARPELEADEVGTLWIVLEVQDGDGATSRALAVVEVTPAAAAELEEAGCGCAASEARSAGGLVLLALLMLARRRRDP